MRKTAIVAMIVGLAAGIVAVRAGLAEPDPLAAYRWSSRLLIVSAPNAADARLNAQRRALTPSKRGLAERDLVTLEAIGSNTKAAALRTRLRLPPDGFRAVLVGKDGGVKLNSDAPIPPQELFKTIDAMPMRQEEMRRR